MGDRDSERGAHPVGRQALRGVGMALTLALFVFGAAALVGAVWVVRWGLAQEELGALLGVIVIVAIGAPLGLVGVIMVAAAVRGVGGLTGRGPARVGRRALESVARVVSLLAIIGLVAWGVAFDRLGWSLGMVGAVIVAMVVIDLAGRRSEEGVGDERGEHADGGERERDAEG